MGIDHATPGSDDPSENAERTAAPDRPPPPPPDKPGSEGYPSRADSRAGAAAANATDHPTADEHKSGYDAAATSSNGEKPDGAKSNGAQHSELAAGSQLNETTEPSTGERPTDLGALPERRLERPAVQGAEVAGNSEEVARLDSPPNVPEPFSSEIAAPLDRSKASTQDVTHSEEQLSADGITIDGPPAGPEKRARPLEVPPANAADAVATSGAEAPLSTSEAERSRGADTPIGASSGSAAESVATEFGTATDVQSPMADSAEPAVADGTDHADQAALTAPQQGDGSADIGHGTPVDASVSKDTRSDDGAVVSNTTELAEDAYIEDDSSVSLASAPPVDVQSTVEKHQVSENGELGGNPVDDVEASRSRTYDISVRGTPVRLRIDPVGAATAHKEIAERDVEPDPVGDRLVEAEDGKRSREDRFRKKAYEIGDDAADLIGKASKTVQEFLARPAPTGHPLTRSVPEISATHEDIDVGNVATGVVVAGIVIGELGYRAYRGMRRKKGDEACR